MTFEVGDLAYLWYYGFSDYQPVANSTESPYGAVPVVVLSKPAKLTTAHRGEEVVVLIAINTYHSSTDWVPLDALHAGPPLNLPDTSYLKRITP